VIRKEAEEVLASANQIKEQAERESEEIAASANELKDNTEKEAQELLREAQENKVALEKEVDDLNAEFAKMRMAAEEETAQISAELEQAKAIIEESKTAMKDAEVEAEIFIFEAEKRAIALKEAALSDSERGRMQRIIEEKEQLIEEMSKAKEEAEKRIEELQQQIQTAQTAIDELRIRTEALAVSGGGSVTASPMDYEIEVIAHNEKGEVDAVLIAKTLSKRSSEGWHLHTVINDEGGRVLATLGGSENISLSGGPSIKEDRTILVFERIRT
jgi:DNA repair exonuclease SbcCD ATPase subunit